MDTPGAFRLNTDSDDGNQQAYHRRDYSERDRQSICEALSKTFGSDEEAWNDIRRRERMAQAMYEC